MEERGREKSRNGGYEQSTDICMYRNIAVKPINLYSYYDWIIIAKKQTKSFERCIYEIDIDLRLIMFYRGGRIEKQNIKLEKKLLDSTWNDHLVS